MNSQVLETEQIILTYTEFVEGSKNSLTWYDIMPGDAVRITGVNDPRTAAEIAAELLLSETPEQEDLIDLVAAKIMNGCSSVDTFENWPQLAFRISEVMSKNLTASGSRPLRMRAQRLNFYLQMIIDQALPKESTDHVVAEKVLEGSKPWDYFCNTSGEWWITSDEKNVHYRKHDGSEQHWRLGLPTQIDPQSDGRVAIGSFFSTGAWLGNGHEWEFIEHGEPIILVFEYCGKRYFLDYVGTLWEYSSRQVVASAIIPQVHFARYFDGVIYVIDNNDFGCVTTFALETLKVERHSVLPVQVCNDLVACNNGYYLIDKQQGSVFKFAKDWQYEGRALRFGAGSGCLQDPVALRMHGDNLQVVSWLTATLIELKKFNCKKGV